MVRLLALSTVFSALSSTSATAGNVTQDNTAGPTKHTHSRPSLVRLSPCRYHNQTRPRYSTIRTGER